MLNVTAPRMFTAPQPKFGSVDFGADSDGLRIDVYQDEPGEPAQIKVFGQATDTYEFGRRTPDGNPEYTPEYIELLTKAQNATDLLVFGEEGAVGIVELLQQMLESPKMAELITAQSGNPDHFRNLFIEDDKGLLWEEDNLAGFTLGVKNSSPV